MEVDGEQQQHGQKVDAQPQQQQPPAAHAAGQAPVQPAATAPAPARNVLSAFGIAGPQADALTAASTQTGPSRTGTGSEADGGSMQDEDDDAGSRGLQGSAPQPPHGAVQLAPRVQEGKKAALQAHWEELRQRAQARGQSRDQTPAGQKCCLIAWQTIKSAEQSGLWIACWQGWLRDGRVSLPACRRCGQWSATLCAGEGRAWRLCLTRLE